jgi:hypothetical protein
MGKPFDDAKLVAMAYAFEQSPGGVRRRPPLTTPALRNGRAPGAQVFSARAGSAVAAFRYDALRNELHYRVTMPATSQRGSQAVVLRRTDAGGPAAVGVANRIRVVQRLVRAGASADSGVITLGELDRRALIDGRLGILHVTTDAPLGRAATLERLVR